MRHLLSLRLGINTLIFSILIGVLSACNHRSLVEPVNTHYVRVYLDENIPNVTTGYYNIQYAKPLYSTPTVLRILLCDPVSGEKIFHRYLRGRGSDEKGNYIDGYINCDAGKYDVLIYNFGTESTLIVDENNFHKAKAYTDRIPTKVGAVYNVPDHLFVSKASLNIPNTSRLDTLYAAPKEHFRAHTIVESFFIQVPVTGLEYVNSISATVTGMSDSKTLKDEKAGMTAINLYTDMEKGTVTHDASYIYATFNTFGRIPDMESEIHVKFTISVISGQYFEIDVNITDEFYKAPALENRWILLEDPIDVPKPSIEGGGMFQPGVEEWKDVTADIVI